MSATAPLVLEDPRTRAVILPDSGARVQQLVDRRTGRELLYSRFATDEGSADYLEATTGGWDLLFPNDEPWNGHPDHGRVWNAGFAVEGRRTDRVALTLELDEPGVRVTRRFGLLEPPRCGIREEVELEAIERLDVFLVASHPMLALEAGWLLALPVGARNLAADRDYPGRFGAGAELDDASWDLASCVPGASPAVVEVLYADGVSGAEARAPDGSAATRVSWDAGALPHLWICTLTGLFGDQSLVILEPSTCRPYRLDEAVCSARKPMLGLGEHWRASVEIESLASMYDNGL